MALTNYDRVGKALELLKKGLIPFVEREMKAAFAANWKTVAANCIKITPAFDKKGDIAWDVHGLLLVMWENWNDVFRRTLGQNERTLVSELRDNRNNWAHQKPFTSDDAYRCLDNVERLLNAVSADETGDIGKQKTELMRSIFDERRRSEMKKVFTATLEGTASTGLKPWREIIMPHPDVASGNFKYAEFAADLWQVYRKEALSEYRDPTEFFRRTFLTEGLRNLMISSIRRLNGTGGDPVIELQTNFGGGKTHSMIALYHLFSGKPGAELPGVEDILAELSTELPKQVYRAVIVGNKISPGVTHEKPDGTKIDTLWGEIAWQLGGKEGYRIVEEADRTHTNPGDLLNELFKRCSPAVILIDEWVAYARQLHQGKELPAGTFDTQFTFAQALTEAAKACPKTMVVVSIPASETEAGGEQGQYALTRLKNTVGRVETSWRPANQDESFEIVRRRLFQPLEGKQFTHRDAVARAFSQLYNAHPKEFPQQCKEAEYERKMIASYPVHPELFDRLYNDWSTLYNFQRTRGVLRLMAAVIHTLWAGGDKNLMIMPGNIPISEPVVFEEINRSLEDRWSHIIEKDVDGPNSLSRKLDNDNPNLGKFSACRRAARTLYIGSAATFRSPNKGLDDRQIKLGCVQPGENPPTFGDAIRHLAERAAYLYSDAGRYWYSTQPTVTRLAEDRAAQYDAYKTHEEIAKQLRDRAAAPGKDKERQLRVHIGLPGRDIPDETEARLVILDADFPHTAKDHASPARKEAQNILDNRGTIPRNFRNTLVFLAVDSVLLKDLENSVRQYLAWTEILKDESLNLDPFQKNQAKMQETGAYSMVDMRIKDAYCWLLVPTQQPGEEITWDELRLQGQEQLAARVLNKLINREMLLIDMGGVRLRHELDKIPLWRGNHVEIKRLAEDFARYVYLARVKSSGLLIEAIKKGIMAPKWQTETFAFAESYDEEKGRYMGLAAGREADVWMDANTLIVKPEAALKQMQDDRLREEERERLETPAPEVLEAPDRIMKGEEWVKEPVKEAAKKLRRFHGAVEVDAQRLARDAGKTADEVVRHLVKLDGARVRVTIEIEAEVPDGVPEDVVRTVMENCRTLKFTSHEFEPD